jgi:hypothetical protein
MRKQREYLRLLEKSIDSVHSAIDSFNRVHDGFKVETCLILLTHAWELLGKAILTKKQIEIRDKDGRTLSAEKTVSQLKNISFLDENQEDCIQQVISLRNEAVHYLLPSIPEEVLHHLFYFSCKFFKDIVQKTFPKYGAKLTKNYLSISFSNLTTYAEKVQKMVGRFKKNQEDRKLIWLLERGVQFDGTHYIAQESFEKEY